MAVTCHDTDCEYHRHPNNISYLASGRDLARSVPRALIGQWSRVKTVLGTKETKGEHDENHMEVSVISLHHQLYVRQSDDRLF